LAAYERELIGLVKAVRHWRPYLWSHSFIVRTDHYALKFLLNQRLSTIPQHTWVSKLFGYDFIVEFNPGRTNIVADALSRCNEDQASVHLLSTLTFQFFDDFRKEAASHPDVVKLKQQIEQGMALPTWSIVDDLVMYKGRIFVPSSSEFWPQILTTAHGQGHEGAQKTLQRLRDSFHPHAARRVRDFIKGCSTCQRNKSEHLHPLGLLHPLEIPSSVWADIAMDFVEGFPKSGGKSVILTGVDRFSKYSHFIALSHPYTVVSVARAFFDNIVRLHGIPCSIVSNRDPIFTSTFWTELFSLSGTQLRMSTEFHPQTDGQLKVTNRILCVYLRCLAGDHPKSWLRWLPWAEYCYNMSYQSALKTTSFHVVYGRPPPPLISYTAGRAKVQALDRQLVDRDVFIQEIRERPRHAQDLMKQHYDAGHRDISFEVGEWVWLRLHHSQAAAITDKTGGKLAPKFYGPFQVKERIGDLSYRLALPTRSQIHNVFHVLFLKKFVGTPPSEVPPLPPIKRGRVLPVPLKIVRTWLNRGNWELLV
jgi:hypothetical protein